MALPEDFRFSDVPPMQAEAERRAIVLFGENWRECCALANDDNGAAAICAKDNILSCDRERIRAFHIGNLHDLPDGSPAIVMYERDGVLKRIACYQSGKLHNPKIGGPAQIYYCPEGSISRIVHCRHGRHEDLFDGTPTKIEYSEAGDIAGGTSSLHGVLSAAQTKERLDAARINRVKSSCLCLNGPRIRGKLLPDNGLPQTVRLRKMHAYYISVISSM